MRRSGGRVDHAFVYEREHETLGDGRFRLRLGVAGNRLSEVSHYVYVPEAFKLRSGNALRQRDDRQSGTACRRGACTESEVAFSAPCGCCAGARCCGSALVAGAIVAGINALGDDRQRAAGLVFLRHGAAGVGFLGVATRPRLPGVSLSARLSWRWCSWPPRVCRAGHSPTTRSFGASGRATAAPTPAILGRTVGGYLLFRIELALIAAFYFVTNRYFGWWQPSEALTDPNILGSALPALAPIGMALQAGFMEECLFRAGALSIAALIGHRFGHRGLLIGLVLVLQAIIFGAAHANYPGFPAYSRLVELVIPAFIWGLIFLRFGLLTTVILHAVFDLVLMSIPVFLVEGSGSGFNQALVIAAGLVPLAIVVLAPGTRRKVAESCPRSLRNGAWRSGAARGPGRRGTHSRSGRALDHSRAACIASSWSCGIAGDSVRCRLPQRRAAAAYRPRQRGSGRRRRAQESRDHARARMEAGSRDEACDGRRNVALAQICMARRWAGCVRAFDRELARTAAVGGALRALRRR